MGIIRIIFACTLGWCDYFTILCGFTLPTFWSFRIIRRVVRACTLGRCLPLAYFRRFAILTIPVILIIIRIVLAYEFSKVISILAVVFFSPFIFVPTTFLVPVILRVAILAIRGIRILPITRIGTSGGTEEFPAVIDNHPVFEKYAFFAMVTGI
jgi:hypothetical protein